jgi:hypothetical protein
MAQLDDDTPASSRQAPGMRTLARSQLALVLVSILLWSCGGATPGSPVPASADAPGDAAAADVRPGLAEALADPTMTRLARAGQEMDAALDSAGGSTAALGDATVEWLTERRTAAVQAALNAAGVQTTGVPVGPPGAKIAAVGSNQLSGPITAAGMAWVGTTVGVPFTMHVMTGRIGEDAQSTGDPVTSHDETTIDGNRVTADTTTRFRSRVSGSTVTVDGEVTQTSTTTSPQGAVLSTTSYTSRVHAELEACPDANGKVTLTIEMDMSSSASGAGTSTFAFSATSQQTGQVGDDAWLTETLEEIDVEQGVTAPDGTRTTGSSSRSIRVAQRPGGGGFDRVVDSTGSVGPGTMDEAESIRWGNFVQLTTMITSSLAFRDAQEAWRGGKCVAVEASERSRDVEADDTIRFEAWPVHVIEGGRLDKPIVATLVGSVSILPEGIKQDAPAPLTYVSGHEEGGSGTVTMKSTSNRGIGTLDVTFTVAPAVVLELEIDSKITPTVLTMMSVVDGSATARGRIRLTEAEPDHWRGNGTLTSVTSSTVGGCRTVHVRGSGTYDWQVRDVVAGPDVTAEDIVVDIDSGPVAEQPDDFTAKNCPVVLTGKMNTWENAFFVVYNDKKNVNGLRVTGWTLAATADTWKQGGLVATATWTGTCPATVIPGLRSGDPPTTIGGIIECSDRTTFKIWAVRQAP